KMKYYFCFAFALLNLMLTAQNTTTRTTHKTTNSSSYGNIDNQSATAVSKEDFEFTADFKETKQAAIQALLLDQLGDEGLNRKTGDYYWERRIEDNRYFFCQLVEGYLGIYLNKTVAPARFIAEVEDLGEELVSIISAHQATGYQGYDPQLSMLHTPRSDKDALEQALHELEAAQRKVARIKKQLEKKE
ncbi:MAG: hypothetical protein AAF840_05955, partial [Bacteroidota bacterium]